MNYQSSNVAGAARAKRRLEPSLHEAAFRKMVERAQEATYAPQWLKVEGVAWYAAQVMTGFERRVAFDLSAAGLFRAYAPLSRFTALRARVAGSEARRKVVVAAAAFPGYVFVGSPGGRGIGKGIDPRIIGFVSCGVSPQRLQGSLIAAINEMELSGEWDRVSRPVAPLKVGENPRWALRTEKAPFAIGETVRIAAGPFAGFNGIVEDRLSRSRVKVGVSMFGRCTPIDFDACELEKV